MSSLNSCMIHKRSSQAHTNPKAWSIITLNTSSSDSCSFTISHQCTFSIQSNCTIGSDFITSSMCCTWEIFAFLKSAFISIPLTISSSIICFTSSFNSCSSTSSFDCTSTIFLGCAWSTWWSEIGFTLFFSC